MRLVALFYIALILFLQPAAARDFVGVGRLTTNDSLATIVDDRWRTGSGVLSFATSLDGSRALPKRFGELVEYRLRGEVISPENIVRPRVGDRPYATALSFGVHTHFLYANTEVSVGADVVMTGTQTGLHKVQGAIHDALDIPGPSAATLASAIPNGLHGALTFEAGRSFDLSPIIGVRPFVELQAGVETLARAGVDFQFGQFARSDALLRDNITGHRYRIGEDFTPGWVGVLGADVAYVADSIFLPASSGVTLSDMRVRARAGVHWQTKRFNLFYGLTWMGKEFEAQRDTQTVGTVRLDIKF